MVLTLLLSLRYERLLYVKQSRIIDNMLSMILIGYYRSMKILFCAIYYCLLTVNTSNITYVSGMLSITNLTYSQDSTFNKFYCDIIGFEVVQYLQTKIQLFGRKTRFWCGLTPDISKVYNLITKCRMIINVIPSNNN